MTRMGAQAAVEVLDREMASLRDEIAEMAATAALQHKFNSGPSEPSGEITHQRLMLGLTATNEVRCMCRKHLGTSLTHSAASHAPPPQSSALAGCGRA